MSDIKKIRANYAWKGERNTSLEADLLRASNVTGVYYPYTRNKHGFIVPKAKRSESDELPLPPTHLWHNYGMPKPGKYLDSLYISQGKSSVQGMRKMSETDGFSFLDGNIMDFGCSGGRMLRHLTNEAQTVECWGVDIHSEAMQWARAHLSPPFHFLTNTTAGHLPFD